MTRCTIGLLITLAVSLVVAALAIETSPSTIGHRIGWLRVGFPDGQSDPVKRPSGRACTTSAMSRAGTSSGGARRGGARRAAPRPRD